MSSCSAIATASEEAVEPHLLDLAYARGLPLVATNEVFFAARDDYEAHDALICIAEGAVIADDKRRRLTPEHYFKSREEMTALFADLPEATREHRRDRDARRVLAARQRKPILPRFAGGGDRCRDRRARRGGAAAAVGEGRT